MEKVEVVKSDNPLWEGLVLAVSPATKQIAWPMGEGYFAIETQEDE